MSPRTEEGGSHADQTTQSKQARNAKLEDASQKSRPRKHQLWYKPQVSGPFQKTQLAKALRRNATPAELRLWPCLRSRRFHNLKSRRQETINRYVVDFYCAELKVAIELDGATHPFRNRYDLQRERDLVSQGIVMIRFTNEQVMRNIGAVLYDLELICGKPHRIEDPN